MAEALHLGEAVDGDGAHVRDAAHVVAAEVDQHQVLGALLGVGQEVGFVVGVLGGRLAAAARSRDGQHEGAALRPAGLDARQHLGRGADQREALAGRVQAVHIEVEEVRARVDLPERAVQVELVAREGHREALAQDHLEDVALDDVLLAGADGRLVGRPLHRGGGLRGQQAHRLAGDAALQQVVLQFHQPLGRLGVRPMQVGVRVDEHGRHQDQLVLDPVEGRDGVVEAPDGVGQAEQVGRPRRQRLQLADGVIADVADGARGQARQARHDGLLGLRQDPAERLEDGPFQRLDLVRGAVALVGARRAVRPDAAAAVLDHQVRALADERVAPQPLAALDRLQQEAELTLLPECEERRHGGQQVGRAADVDGHRQPPPVGRELLADGRLELGEGHGWGEA